MIEHLALAGGFLAVGLWLLLPPGRRWQSLAGTICAALGIGFFASNLPGWMHPSEAVLFWTLAGGVLGAALATVVARNPIHCALWFALTLLLVAVVLMSQGALFVGVATVVVYAGAIVVTLLFVLMLAQPSGAATYDRLSWGRAPTAIATLSMAAVVAMLAAGVLNHTSENAEGTAQPLGSIAPLGAELFGRHILSVDAAGILLLAALVGALAIVTRSQGDAEDERGGSDVGA